MKSNTICFISSKGGAGKTVTSSALGTFLSELGFSVLLVDTDAATNGMTLLFLEQLLGRRRQASVGDQPISGLFDVREGVKSTTIKINDKLHFVPASFTMNDTENTEQSQFENALSNLLRSSNDEYDFIFLDAQAGADFYARTASSFADQKVIVSEYDPVSAQGIERLKILFSKILDPGSTWILFNKVLPEFASVIGEGLSVARYLMPVPWDADVVRAFARRDLAINMQAPNPYTLAISQVAYTLLPDETGEAIEKWRLETLDSVTSPLESRLKELLVIEKALHESKRSKLRGENMAWGAFLLVSGFGAFGIIIRALGVAKESHFGMYDFYSSYTVSSVIITTSMVATLFARDHILRFIFGDRAKSDEMTFALLREEQSKLRTGIAAAESALRFSRSAGYYERHRRSSSPKNPGRDDNIPTSFKELE